MRILIFALWLLCLSSCAVPEAHEPPNLTQTASTQNASSNAANPQLRPTPTSNTQQTNSNQQTPCSKESQFKTVKYEELPKEVKARIDRTSKNEYSEFLMLTYQRIENPRAKEPRCQTYYTFNAKTARDGLDVPKNESAGWTFVRVGEHWKYVSWL